MTRGSQNVPDVSVSNATSWSFCTVSVPLLAMTPPFYIHENRHHIHLRYLVAHAIPTCISVSAILKRELANRLSSFVTMFAEYRNKTYNLYLTLNLVSLKGGDLVPLRTMNPAANLYVYTTDTRIVGGMSQDARCAQK